MTVSRIHSPYGVQLHTDAMGASVVLDGIVSQGLSTETTVESKSTSGEIYRRFLALVAQNPMARFATHNIATALDNVGLTGLPIAAATNPGVNFFAYAHLAGGSRKTGSNHRKYNFKLGIVVPKRLRIRHQQSAELEYEIIPIWDGTNDPIVIADTSAVPTQGGDVERFGLKSVAVGGVTIGQVQEVELDFGLKVSAKGGDGDIWNSFVSIDEVEPKISITTTDVEAFKSSNIPLIGKAAAHADTLIKLRKRAQGGTFVADATAEHILLTACGLAYVTEPFADEDNKAAVKLELCCRYDGTNAPVVFDTTYALA